MYAEVILPLPLQGTFTYTVPEELAADTAAGSRVMVQFGRKKFYTGIVHSISPIPRQDPREVEVKPIVALLDPKPIVSRNALKLWQWAADYYLCTIGEVMKAALPSGLKPESETKVTVNPDIDLDSADITESQAGVLALLSAKKVLSIDEIASETGSASAQTDIRKLINLGVLEISERLNERYRPKQQTMVRLKLDRANPDALHDAMDSLSRSRKQERLLMAFLEMSGWLKVDKPEIPVARAELLDRAGVTAAVLKGLIDKGIMETYKVTINRFASTGTETSPPHPLSETQIQALGGITSSMSEKQVTLLHGVTGSGKTEIYIELIQRVVNQGGRVLYLVPEISLTTQLTDRLRRVFGDQLIVYHSKFTDNERVDIYRRLLSDTGPRLILGARSAVFLPLDSLSLVIVDEEHEASFKQYDPSPRYNARDLAIMLSTFNQARVLLGSATPSVESYYKALNGKYGLVEIKERFGDASLPEVEIVDMREARRKKKVSGILSDRLRAATSETLGQQSQVIMFQNRRGFAPVVVCRSCGWSPKCENCDISLVYHKSTNALHCHYCGFTRRLPDLCPVCGLNDVEVFGYGTERIADELHSRFEGYRVARMDLDTTRSKDAQLEIIEEFSDHQTDILVGTQMVSKGLDFAGVKLVGVLNADTLLNFPDFRSNERAFNMLEQVAGRAGRKGAPGRVVIQTTQPDSPVLAHVKNHDYMAYYREEIADRERYLYPPFSRIIMIYLRNKDQKKADAAAVQFAVALRQVFGNRVLGPEKPFVSRVATWYIQTVMLKVEANASMAKVKQYLLEIYRRQCRSDIMKGTQVYYDVDPA